MKKLILASGAAALAMSFALPAMACEMMRSVGVDLAPMQVTVTDTATPEPVKQAEETAPAVAEPTEQELKTASETGDEEPKTELAQSVLTKTQ